MSDTTTRNKNDEDQITIVRAKYVTGCAISPDPLFRTISELVSVKEVMSDELIQTLLNDSAAAGLTDGVKLLLQKHPGLSMSQEQTEMLARELLLSGFMYEFDWAVAEFDSGTLESFLERMLAESIKLELPLVTKRARHGLGQLSIAA